MIQDQAVEEYIARLRFKRKSFGGCDEEDVLVKMRELRDIYRTRSEALQTRLEQEERRRKELERQLRTVTQENDAALRQAARRQAQAKSAALAKEAYAEKPRVASFPRPLAAPEADVSRRTRIDAAQEAEWLRQASQALRRQYGSLAESLKSDSLLLTAELDEILKIVASLRAKVAMLSGSHEPHAR